MNHVSIFEKKWLDLVFEGKNKSYGAYQLRRENPRTTLTALFYGFLFLAGLVAILALSSFVNKPDAVPGTDENPYVLHPVNLPAPKPKTPVNAAPVEKQKPDEPKKSNLPPVVAHIPDPDPVPTKPTSPEPTSPTATPGTGGTPGPVTVTPTTGGGEVPGPDNGLKNTSSLDKLPEFPGGIDKFYKYVGDKFEKPEINDAKSIRVFVTFVIERDGTMTDIKVGRDPGYGLGKEAVRVLKSLKTKWKPGMIHGQPVRTAYSLPITVNME